MGSERTTPLLSGKTIVLAALQTWHMPCDVGDGASRVDVCPTKRGSLMSNSREVSSQSVPKQTISRRRLLAGASGLALGVSLGLAAAAPARADDTIKVGILHSLS